MKLRKTAQFFLILASMAVGACDKGKVATPAPILPANSDERKILAKQKFDVKIYRNDIHSPEIRDPEIAKIFRMSNESIRELLPGIGRVTDAVIFVPDAQRIDFMLADGGDSDDLGMHTPSVHVIVVTRQSLIETVGTLNHERIHCMFHTDNETFARFGEYVLTMDQALAANNAPWAKNAGEDWDSYLKSHLEVQMDPFLILANRYKTNEWKSLGEMFNNGDGMYANYGWAGSMSLDYTGLLQAAAVKVMRSHRSRYVHRCAVDPYHCLYFDFAPDEREAYIRRTRPALASQMPDGIRRN